MPEPSDLTPAEAGWDAPTTEALIHDLWALRQAMLDHAAALAPQIDAVDAAHRPSALNLAHYLALRQGDLRELQSRLAWIGVSSLGRSESHVLANLDKVLGLLHRLLGRPWSPLSDDEPVGFRRGAALQAQHAEALFGPPPAGRATRIMVTLPSEAAADAALVDALVAAGMDVARINCAHDGPVAWEAMAVSVRRAAAAAGRPVRVLMDVAGPKLRTGPVAEGPAVLHLKPRRDAWGRVTTPLQLGLCPRTALVPLPGAQACVGVDPAWLTGARPGDTLALTDTRGAHRVLTVEAVRPDGLRVSGTHSLYLDAEVRLHWQKGAARAGEATMLTGIPAPPGALHLARGDHLRLLAEGLGRPAAPGDATRPAEIACTLPAVLAQVRVGQRIWFDDGHIGGVVRAADARALEVEITEVPDGGAKLAADKGINLPDTALDLPALTAQDLEDLATVARCADLVGLSFAQSAADVRALRDRLTALGAPALGLVLKVETRRGFAQLPEMLLAAMAGPAAGVMIARGDLAVECGYERLAEVQEEILWACEAAHLPVVWATQVLENLAKTGAPSRAEITDAAMGERAECVMLNKGPHIVEAIRLLDDILRRMQAHQAKKRPLLRALRAWGAADA